MGQYLAKACAILRHCFGAGLAKADAVPHPHSRQHYFVSFGLQDEVVSGDGIPSQATDQS